MSKLARADIPHWIPKRPAVNVHRQRKISSCPSTPTRGQISNTTQLLHQVVDTLEDEYSTDKIQRLPKKKKKRGSAKKPKPKKERKGVSVWKFVTLDFTKDVNRPELKNKNVTNPFGDILNKKVRKESSSCPPSPSHQSTSQLLEEVPEEGSENQPPSSQSEAAVSARNPSKRGRRHGAGGHSPTVEGMYDFFYLICSVRYCHWRIQGCVPVLPWTNYFSKSWGFREN